MSTKKPPFNIKEHEAYAFLRYAKLELPIIKSYKVSYSEHFDRFIYTRNTRGKGKTINSSSHFVRAVEIGLYQGEKGKDRLLKSLNKSRRHRLKEIAANAAKIKQSL